MSNLDIANNIKITHLNTMVITIDQTIFTGAIDTANYDGGYFLSPFMVFYNSGTFTFTLQESDESGSGFTDVPANKLIDPSGTGSIVLDGVTPSVTILEKLGSFSTKRFIRFKLVSAGTAGQSVIPIIATRNPELKPDFSDTI